MYFAARHPLNGRLILIKFGETGYHEATDFAAAEKRIAEQGPDVTESALMASMFGWDCNCADLARAYAQ